jgi:FkbM family methyltransferase
MLPLAFLYRMSLRLDRMAASAGAGMPAVPVQQSLRRIKRLAQRVLHWDRGVGVRVQSGLSGGMWIRVRLPEELRYWQGQHEQSTQRGLAGAVRDGAVVYDVGCHIGSLALGMARLAGPRGRVVAFDGDPGNVARLQESCVRNGLQDRLQVVHAAVWSFTAPGGIPFRCGLTRTSHGGVEIGGNHAVPADGPLMMVPAIRLDDFIASHVLLPELVKIDVEGGEAEVLRGGSRLFSERRPRIVVEVHHRQALDQIEQWLRDFRYEAGWEVPRQGFPRILFGWPVERPGDRFP